MFLPPEPQKRGATIYGLMGQRQRAPAGDSAHCAALPSGTLEHAVPHATEHGATQSTVACRDESFQSTDNADAARGGGGVAGCIH